jgi:hypothetical protein
VRGDPPPPRRTVVGASAGENDWAKDRLWRVVDLSERAVTGGQLSELRAPGHWCDAPRPALRVPLVVHGEVRICSL